MKSEGETSDPDLGRKLQIYRERAGESQEQIGELLGKSGRWISNVERSKAKLTQEQIQKLISHWKSDFRLENLAGHIDTTPVDEGTFFFSSPEHVFNWQQRHFHEVGPCYDLWFTCPQVMPFHKNEMVRRTVADNLNAGIHYKTIWLLDTIDPDDLRFFVTAAARVEQLLGERHPNPNKDRGYIHIIPVLLDPRTLSTNHRQDQAPDNHTRGTGTAIQKWLAEYTAHLKEKCSYLFCYDTLRLRPVCATPGCNYSPTSPSAQVGVETSSPSTAEPVVACATTSSHGQSQSDGQFADIPINDLRELHQFFLRFYFHEFAVVGYIPHAGLGLSHPKVQTRALVEMTAIASFDGPFERPGWVLLGHESCVLLERYIETFERYAKNVAQPRDVERCSRFYTTWNPVIQDYSV